MRPSVKKLLLFASTAPYSGAQLVLDFVGSRTSGQPYYMLNGVNYPSVSGVPGWTYTGGASTGCYAARLDGSLQFFPQNVPRITDAGYWAEEARTNLLLRSQEFDNAAWTKGTVVTISSNATAAPDGTTTADLVIPSIASSTHEVTQSATHTAASYTVSIYAKPAGYDRIGFRENTTSGAYVVASLTGSGSNLANNLGTSTITALANGWYRVTMAWTASAVSQQLGFYVVGPGYTSGSPHAYSWAGDGTSGVYFWQAQDELGAFATSPIPTTSVAVTRAADMGYVLGLTIPSAWTMLESHVAQGALINLNVAAELNDGAITNRAFTAQNGSATLYGNDTVASIGGTGASITVPTSGNVSGAITTSGTNLLFAANGSAVSTAATSLPANTSLTRVYVGNRADAARAFGNAIRRIVIYPRAFANSELQAITTAGAY